MAAMPEKCLVTRRSSNMICASYVAFDIWACQVGGIDAIGTVSIKGGKLASAARR